MNEELLLWACLFGGLLAAPILLNWERAAQIAKRQRISFLMSGIVLLSIAAIAIVAAFVGPMNTVWQLTSQTMFVFFCGLGGAAVKQATWDAF